MKAPLSADEVEVLLTFEETESMELVSQRMTRDKSVISRLLTRISEKGRLLEKVSGKWKITEQGRLFNSISRDLIQAQKLVLNQKISIRIGCNREFGARILAPQIAEVKQLLDVQCITVKSYERGIESALLSGEIDFGFDCGKPYSQDIAFKSSVIEPISIVCSPQFYKNHAAQFKTQNYGQIPMVSYERISPEQMDDSLSDRLFSEYEFNDLASARAACVAGLGWMFAPLYSVKDELERNTLLKAYEKNWSQPKYGVWWLRSRKQLSTHVKLMNEWLSQQKL